MLACKLSIKLLITIYSNMCQHLLTLQIGIFYCHTNNINYAYQYLHLLLYIYSNYFYYCFTLLRLFFQLHVCIW